MTSATEHLRALLTARGVEWGFGRVERRYTAWVASGWHMSAKELADGSLLLQAHSVAHFTPEQAIDATLERGTCRFEQIPEALYDDIECSECGVALWGFQMDIAGEGCPTRPRYCPNCGRKVVE